MTLPRSDQFAEVEQRGRGPRWKRVDWDHSLPEPFFTLIYRITAALVAFAFAAAITVIAGALNGWQLTTPVLVAEGVVITLLIVLAERLRTRAYEQHVDSRSGTVIELDAGDFDFRVEVEESFAFKEKVEITKTIKVLTPPDTASRWQRFVKRVIDFVGASVGIVIVAPLMVLVALMIKIESRGPVFFRAWRIGKLGHPIGVWKFRTLKVDAEPHAGEGAQVALGPRITEVGRWLRRWSLDSLPSLYNVLVGDMTIVGPQPLRLGEEEFYGPSLPLLLSVKPGITGPSQIDVHLSPTDYERRVAIDIDYVKRRSLWRDLLVLLRSIRFSAGGL